MESVPLPDLDAQLAGIGTGDPGLRFRLGADLQTFQRVTFQHDHTGYFQLHFPNQTTENGMRFRCVATHPDDPLQVVKSNWASLTLLGMRSQFLCINLGATFVRKSLEFLCFDPCS